MAGILIPFPARSPVIPHVGVTMKLLGGVLVFLSLLPIPAVGQGIGSVTLMEGSLRVVRGTTVFQAAEGMRLRQGDILENSEKGFAQLEFVGGTIVALGPASRLYIFRHGQGGKAGGEANGGDLVLLSGWLKGESKAGAGSYRYESPMLAAATGNGTVIFHCDESGCDLFVESGSAAVSEVSPQGNSRQPAGAKSGQFFARRAAKDLTSLPRPNPAFVDAMPVPFRDTLPSRLAHFTGKPAEPKAEHPVSYAEIQPWLTMPSAWRKGFVDRFEPRLKDPEFRKQLEMHVAEYPEWDPILHPEKQPAQSPSTAVSSPESLHPRV
jgi:hypothetical protein